jgi:p-aminobenzoyl-glutamate transporter AbgT
MGANTTYRFLHYGELLAQFTFMFGYTNIGQVVEIAGHKYLVDEVIEEGEADDDQVVTITLLDYV